MRKYIKTICFAITQEDVDFFGEYPGINMSEFTRVALDKEIKRFKADPEKGMAEYIASKEKER